MSKIDDINIEIQHIQQQMQEYLQMHWRLFLAEGILFIFLGLSAIVVPQFFYGGDSRIFRLDFAVRRDSSC